MMKSKIAATCLLSVCMCGCPEEPTNKKPSERTGSVGVTSQDLDDLAKPVAPANPGGAGK
jgi:hypothetical protein